MTARTPEECIALFVTRLNGKDLEALLDLYEPDATFVQQSGPQARGHTEIRPRLAAFLAIHAAIRMDVTRAIETARDLAVLYTDWTLTAEGPDGRPMPMSGRAVEVLRRQKDGTWKIAFDDLFGRA